VTFYGALLNDFSRVGKIPGCENQGKRRASWDKGRTFIATGTEFYACANRDFDGCMREWQSSAAMILVQTFPHFLTGFEKGNCFLIHWHMRSGARIATDSCIPVFHGKSPKTAQFDTVAAR
jgi:hypothetical protein